MTIAGASSCATTRTRRWSPTGCCVRLSASARASASTPTRPFCRRPWRREPRRRDARAANRSGRRSTEARATRPMTTTGRSPIAPLWSKRAMRPRPLYRKAHPDSLDIPYAPGAPHRFRPLSGARPGAPCLVFIHGGYWLRNSRELFAAYGEGLAHRRLVDRDAGLYACAASEPYGHRARKSASRSTGSPTTGRRMASRARWWCPAGRPARNWRRCISGIGCVAAGLAISGVYDLGPLRDTGLNDVLKLSDEEIATLSPVRSPPTLAEAARHRLRNARASGARSRFARAPRAARGGSCAGPAAADRRRGSFHHSRRTAPSRR